MSEFQAPLPGGARRRDRDESPDAAEEPRRKVLRRPQEEELMQVAVGSWGPIPEARYLICEAFSPPRVAARAREGGLRGGWSLDWSVVDPITGMSWDLSNDRALRKAKPD